MTLPVLAVAFLVSSAVWVWAPPFAGVLLTVGAGLSGLWGWKHVRVASRVWFFVLLWCGLVLNFTVFSPNPSATGDAVSVEVEVFVSGDPDKRVSFDGSPSYRIPVKLNFLSANPGRFQTNPLFSKRALLISDDEDHLSALLVGTRWRAVGRLEHRDGPHTGLFRSSGRFYPDEGSLDPMPVQTGDWIIYGLFQIRHALASRLGTADSTSSDEHAVLKALLLGDRSGLEQEVMDPFVRTGLVHVFAISGLHIAMLAGMIWFCLRGGGMSYRLRALVALPLLFIFILFSGFGASSLRAFIMLGCLWAAPLWYRRLDIMQALALAVSIILAVSPGQVADVGFQYSFLLVSGLLVFTPAITAQITDSVRADPWAPAHPVRTALNRWFWSPVLQALVVSSVSMVIASPLTAYYFNLFSPIGVLGNLLAVPLVFLILLTGFPVLIISLLPVSELNLLWAVPEFFAHLLTVWTSWLESFAAGWFWIRSPSVWIVCGGLGCLFMGAWRPNLWRPCLCASLAFLSYFCTQEFIKFGTTELIRLPTDRGQAFLLRRGFHPAVLIDAGSEWDAWHIQKTLKQEGINRLEAVFLTHDDPNHIQGWANLASTWKAGHLYGSANRIDRIRKISSATECSGLRAGTLLEHGGWDLEILHPPLQWDADRSDDQTLVIRSTAGFRSLLFMGGGGGTVEEHLLSTNQPVAARVLCAGNPRSDRMVDQTFFEKVKPDIVLFSGRGFNGITPARRDAEQRLGATGLRVIRGREHETRIISL